MCGPRCFGGSYYSVGFIRLSAPKELGSNLVTESCSKPYKSENVEGIKDLVRFLKHGKFFEEGDMSTPVDISRRIPALLSLPRAEWQSHLLVPNGTPSMVFMGNPTDTLQLIKKVRPSKRIASFQSTFVEQARVELDGAAKDATYFLKIRLTETTLRDDPSFTATECFLSKNAYFKELYPIQPMGNGECGIFLMNNCGESLADAIEQMNFHDFCGLFAVLWKVLMEITDTILHGDALPRNMVYNRSSHRLVLIDFDEGL